jgi:hypothetical protein
LARSLNISSARMLRRAAPGRAEADLARLRLAQRDEVLDGALLLPRHAISRFGVTPTSTIGTKSRSTLY